MPTDVSTIVSRIQNELQDFGKKWATFDYIVNFLSTANEDVCTRLESQDLAFQINVIVLPAVPADTTDLSSYQIQGSPLYGLVIPRSMEWRFVGQNDEQWQIVTKVDKVIDTNTAASGQPVASNEPGIDSYEWRGGIIYISPSNQPVDIRLRGEFLPPLLNNDSDVQIVGLTNPLVYRTCWKIANTRSQMSNMVAVFDAQYKEAIDNYEVMQVKERQNTPQRFGGRRTAMGSGEFAGGMMPPTM